MGCLATAAPVGWTFIACTHARFRVVASDTRDDATQWCESVDVLPDEVEEGVRVVAGCVLQLVEQLGSCGELHGPLRSSPAEDTICLLLSWRGAELDAPRRRPLECDSA